MFRGGSRKGVYWELGVEGLGSWNKVLVNTRGMTLAPVLTTEQVSVFL